MEVIKYSGKAHKRVLLVLILLVSVVMSAACATPGRDDAMALSTQDVFALSAAAERAYQSSRWIDAVRHYEKLSREVPEDAYTWFRLANAYARQGDYRRAISAYEASISLDPQQPKPWFNLSSAYILNARHAMQSAHDMMHADDRTRHVLRQRLAVLDSLLHQRFEDQSGPAASVAYR